MLITGKNVRGTVRRRFKLIDLPDGIELPDGHITCDDSVRIQSLTEGETSAYEKQGFDFKKSAIREEGFEDQRRRLLRLVWVDENGSPQFTADDDQYLRNLDNLIATTVANAAMEFCGLRRVDVEATKKNSDATNAAAGTGN